MRLSKVCAVSCLSSALACCAAMTGSPRAPAITHVNPASVAASPTQWDGRQVEMVGLLVWEFEQSGLYQSYGAYCRGAEKAAIYVDWNNWPGVTRSDSRRQVVVRGLFRNLQGTTQPSGAPLISNAAPGPGPLQPGAVVRWLSPKLRPCPAARP
jgi:hypothetical protein